jgi:hypothetical protein
MIVMGRHPQFKDRSGAPGALLLCSGRAYVIEKADYKYIVGKIRNGIFDRTRADRYRSMYDMRGPTGHNENYCKLQNFGVLLGTLILIPFQTPLTAQFSPVHCQRW